MRYVIAMQLSVIAVLLAYMAMYINTIGHELQVLNQQEAKILTLEVARK